MGKTKWDLKTYRATWEDVENWVQAHYEDFGAQCRINVVLPMGSSNVKPAVTVQLYKPRGEGRDQELYFQYSPLDIRAPHHAEHIALQLLSQAWLELERDKAEAERQASF